jgi:DNA-binding phage protein
VGTDGAGTNQDRAQAAELVSALLGKVDSSKRPISSLAEQFGISRSAVSRWKSGALPRTFHAQLVGAAAGLRLEWVPLAAGRFADDTPPRRDPPVPLAMMPWTANPVSTGSDPDPLRAALYDAYLLSAEVRWARIYVKVWSHNDCPGDHHTWSAFEGGPTIVEPDGSSRQHRRYRSVPLATTVFIGRSVGLRLEWATQGDPYRVRPWESQKPPPLDDATEALRDERRRRPRLW